MVIESNFTFPLVDSSYDNQEILGCIETLLSGRLTMGERVKEFEHAFAKHIGAKHAVMVNSGSSANLLAVSAAINPLRSRRLPPGAYVAVPAVCWSTSLWPLVQLGLRPVLVDADPATLNLSLQSLRSALARYPIQALMMVHVLGNSTDLEELMSLVQEHDLLLIEDTCESLGTRFKDKWLGTLGSFGTFSFFFSHHMTTIEGGMVVTNDDEDYDLLKCLRAHGWTREQRNRTEIESRYPHIDPRFLFVNVGYNLRPMEIQASFGLEQLKRLDDMNACRSVNTNAIRSVFTAHARWRSQLVFPTAPNGVLPCWFGFPFLVNPAIDFDYPEFTKRLNSLGIDTRPIVSGNMDLQPAVRLFDIERGLAPYSGAQLIHDRGVFIGAHTKPLASDRINWLVDSILDSLDTSGT